MTNVSFSDGSMCAYDDVCDLISYFVVVIIFVITLFALPSYTLYVLYDHS